MYVVPQYDIKILLISSEGDTVVYDNYNGFIESTSIYFVRNHIVTTFKDAHSNLLLWLNSGESTERFIVRDALGSVFSTSEIINDISNLLDNRYKDNKYYKQQYNGVVFRRTPIPYTGTGRYKFGCFYKKPKTTQEKRLSFAHSGLVRGKRRANALPDTWDDVVRSDVYTRKNWKHYKKKKQWL